MRKTKIVCTIGPATDSRSMIDALLQAGMNVARLNFSHGSNEEHRMRLQILREEAARLGKNLGILLDIQGPKIRIGKIKDNLALLHQGEEYTLTVEEIEGDEKRAFVSYPDILTDVKPGNTIYIDDGLLELRVKEVLGQDVVCTVIVGGELSSRKGVTLPGVDVKLPPITDADEEHIRFGVQNGVDFIAASFVRRAEHVEEVKRIIKDAGGNVPVIAKIESDEGLRYIDEIIDVAEGIMVARGDLGVEIPPEEVPLAQKMLIKKCNNAGIPVITATQMLDSMIRNPRPTRAEITDVANAIFDGTDAVMLSGETAVGKYPVQAVHMMARIAARIERSINYQERLEETKVNSTRKKIPEAIALATCQTAYDVEVKAIICATRSGQTAQMISKFRPHAPIIAASPHPTVGRSLAVTWGVYPVEVPDMSNLDGMISLAVKAAKDAGFVVKGDLVVVTGGTDTGVPGSTNLLQLYQVY